ncbi:hypothetical protein [Salipiger abyssi]|uniref:hypothetical protein n=1 Tax=Salipiger abyssi TaxID=1250539 RepID=UPI001A906A88|nr:hypothetical protein [Salipiger abyssi]MBN9886721.1 hypothetical protein [Salipiger abyssi]
MSRRFIAAVLSVSLAVTAFAAAPARADERDLARLIGTAATLAVIGTAISRAQSQESSPIRVHETWRYGSNKSNSKPPRVIGPAFGRGKDRDQRRALPRSCALEVSGGRSRYVIDNRCLKRNGLNTERFPNRCEMNIRTRNGIHKAFSAECLQRSGYQIENRHNRQGAFGRGWHGPSHRPRN